MIIKNVPIIFEDVIKLVNWNKNTNTIEVKTLLIKKYTLEQMLEIENFIYNTRNILLDAFFFELDENGEEMNYTDSHSDFACQIIGEGLDSVEKCLNNKEAALIRFQAGDYTESFLYCIPDTQDYKNYRALFN